MILLTEFYVPKDKIRERDFEHCLNYNVANPYISKIILYTNEVDTPRIKSPKIEIIRNNIRPTYQTFFDKSCEVPNDSIWILANSDITIEHEDLIHIHSINMDQKFLCLNRHEADGKIFNVPYSQDVWIWKGHCPIKDADMKLGVPGCDNKIAYLALMAGLMPRNPSLQIKCYHYHSMNDRNITHIYRGPYLIIWPQDDIRNPSRFKIISRF